MYIICRHDGRMIIIGGGGGGWKYGSRMDDIIRILDTRNNIDHLYHGWTRYVFETHTQYSLCL